MRAKIRVVFEWEDEISPDITGPFSAAFPEPIEVFINARKEAIEHNPVAYVEGLTPSEITIIPTPIKEEDLDGTNSD